MTGKVNEELRFKVEAENADSKVTIKMDDKELTAADGVYTVPVSYTHLNAAARMNGLSYSKFMYGLKLAGIDMNRKMLAEMAVNDAEGFATLAELAKSKIA